MLFSPLETAPETRVSITPETARLLTSLGANVVIEKNAGLCSEHTDDNYIEAGAVVTTDRDTALREADIILRVRKPALNEISCLKKGALHLSFFDPFQDSESLNAFAVAGVKAVSMEMMPRTTLAQKMDALSSQANLAGYFAVILAAERLNRILPMMMTPAGTLSPAKVFVIGVGVAGLQAIATAKRLGARVEAFDTRPIVEEQVKSLGARFVKIDIGETGETEQGYARELTPEQLELQRLGMAKICAQSDIVITTAKLFGRKAPIVLNHAMIADMKRGSVVVDLAAESGGNVEGVVLDEEVITENGIRIIGARALETCVPTHASQVYAANLASFLEHFWDKAGKTLNLRREDEILKGCLLTADGEVVHEHFCKKS